MGSLTLERVTLANNRAQGGQGGNVNFYFNLNGRLTVPHSTFSANQANQGGALYTLGYTSTVAVTAGSVATTTVRNSILANSTQASTSMLIVDCDGSGTAAPRP